MVKNGSAPEEKEFEVRDMRRKEKFVLDDAYLNGWAKKCGVYASAVYMSLARHADKYQLCWPSIKKIAEEHSISQTQTRRAIKILTEHNIIKVERLGKKLNNRYYLLDKSEWSDRTISERPNRTLTTSPQDTHQCPDRTLHSKDTHIKDTQRKDIPATAGLPSQNSSCRNAPPQKNAAPPPPFNSRKYLKKILETDRSKHCRIIAYYALIKKIDFPTEKAVSRFIARNSKVATELAEYPKSRIDRAIDEIMGDERCATFNWGLETIIKKIAK
ncbi:MAG: helix-turn-helix domain-containing protein [Bacteroidales bacterium]|jgi:DNA-binding transcriptional ArsR family regulator